MSTRKIVSLWVIGLVLPIILIIATILLYSSLHPEKTDGEVVFVEWDPIEPTMASKVAVEFNNVVRIDYSTVKAKLVNDPEEPVISTIVDGEGEEVEFIQDLPKFSGDKQEFINYMGPYAVRLWSRHKILPSLTLAQTIIETGSGTHSIGFNFGGVKACCQSGGITEEFGYDLAGGLCTAGYCTNHPDKLKSYLWTMEAHDGGLFKEQHWFVYYRDIDEFLESRYTVLKNENYYPGLIGEEDYLAATQKVFRYASGADYIAVLRNEIETQNLTDWDPDGTKYKEFTND